MCIPKNEQAVNIYQNYSMKSRKLLIIITVIWILIFLPFFVSYGEVCWDGMKMDTEKLYKQCGVTIEQYEERIKNDKDFCTEANEFWEPIGSCDKEIFVNWDLFIPQKDIMVLNILTYLWSAGLICLITLIFTRLFSKKHTTK